MADSKCRAQSNMKSSILRYGVQKYTKYNFGTYEGPKVALNYDLKILLRVHNSICQFHFRLVFTMFNSVFQGRPNQGQN